MPRSSVVDELRVWEWPGDPPDTLLMHGIGNYGRYWDFFADAIAGRLRLVAPDARGHGESRKPDDGYAPSDFVADVITVLDGLAIDRAVVVGHSMGGFHATALAIAHPDRVRALVLVDVGPRAEEVATSRARRLTLERPDRFPSEAEAVAYLRETSPDFSDEVYRNRITWAFARDRGELTWHSSKPALAQILDTRRDGAAVWQLERITCPVLVVRGTRSVSFAEATARDMMRRLGDARFMELDARHNVPLDRPRELADAVVEFARGVR